MRSFLALGLPGLILLGLSMALALLAIVWIALSKGRRRGYAWAISALVISFATVAFALGPVVFVGRSLLSRGGVLFSEGIATRPPILPNPSFPIRGHATYSIRLGDLAWAEGSAPADERSRIASLTSTIQAALLGLEEEARFVPERPCELRVRTLFLESDRDMKTIVEGHARDEAQLKLWFERAKDAIDRVLDENLTPETQRRTWTVQVATQRD